MDDPFDGPTDADGGIDAVEAEFGLTYLDVRIFEQDECWVNPFGEILTLDTMEQDELFVIVAFLFSNADLMYISVVKRLLFELMLEAGENELTQSHPLIVKALYVTDMVPVEWLRHTPLMLKMEALLEA